jgi:glycosyltransferase involved in cell wall biosynthesis
VHSAFDVRIFHKECRSLAAAGYDVVLVAPHDRAEIVEGVRIEPVSRNGSRLLRMTRTVWEVYRKAVRSRASLVHFHDPELIPVGVLLKLKGKRVIYDAHEHVAHDILTKDWIYPSVRRLVSRAAHVVETLATYAFDEVIAATPAIINSFPKEKSTLLQNFPIVGELAKGTETPYQERAPLVLYVGSITEMKGAREMVEAMHRLEARLQARLLLLGETESPDLKAELTSVPGWERVDYLGLQPRTMVAQLAGGARVGLVLFRPLPNYDDSQPNKLFEYMSAGLPVVASNFPAWRALIEQAGCGLVVDPLDADQIASAITWILDHPAEAEAMGKRGQQAVCATYNWSTQERNLVALYDRLLQQA